MLCVAFPDGTEQAEAAKEGDEDSRGAWQELIDTFTAVGSNCHAYMEEHGYGDRYFGSYVINEKDTDRYLLLCKNETVVYDIVNGIGFEEGDEDETGRVCKEGEAFNIGDLEIMLTKKNLGYEADDKECEQEYFDADFINSNLGGGRSLEFETYYKVPKDAKSLELEYTPMLGEGERVIVVIK